MHFPSIWGLLIILGLAFLLFSRPGRIAGLMKDLGEGIKGFRKGLADDDKPAETPPPQVADQSARRESAETNGDRAQQ